MRGSQAISVDVGGHTFLKTASFSGFWRPWWTPVDVFSDDTPSASLASGRPGQRYHRLDRTAGRVSARWLEAAFFNWILVPTIDVPHHMPGSLSTRAFRPIARVAGLLDHGRSSAIPNREPL